MIALTALSASAEPASSPAPAPVASPAAATASNNDDSGPQQVIPASADQPFVHVWLGDNATLSDDLIAQVMAAVRQQQADPQHIVLLVHGLDTPRADSTAQFTVMARRAIAAYERRGKRVAVIGFQWHSYLGPPKMWVLKVLTATLGLDSDNPYLSKVTLAQNMGRTAGRQLVLAINQQLPQVQLDILAHSLGCDLTRNIVSPFLRMQLVRNKFMPAETPLFAPEALVSAGVVALAGADLDYDLLYQNRESTPTRPTAKLIWLTVGGVKNPDRRDLVLSIRALARGDRAMGNTIPRMGRRQIDTLCSNRRLVLDGFNIPTYHDILKYYDEVRVERVVSAAVNIGDPSVPDPLLAKLSDIINAPADPKVLQEFFNHNQDLTVTYYTLWRLEGICCGGPRHLSDGYLEWLGRLLGDRPRDIAIERWKGPCLVVRDGWWPTPRQVYRNIERLPGQAGRPQFTLPQGF